jgi:hypothetical protein
MADDLNEEGEPLLEEIPPHTMRFPEEPDIEFTEAEVKEMDAAGITLPDAIRAIEHRG